MISERKCENLTFLLSVLVCTDAILIVSVHQSAHKAEILTKYIKKFNLVSKFDSINQKAAQLISQCVESNVYFHAKSHKCSTFLYILQVGRHPEYSASLTDVIPFLDSAQQSNTTVCLTASSLKGNVNI